MTVRIKRRPWGLLVAPIAIVSMAMLTMTDASAATPAPGSQGTDTRLPTTDSEATVHGRGSFADLAVTINQTKNLTNQAVSITWTGGQPTVSGPGRFGSRYLQIMQCWGDDDGSVPGNPGPPPQQCEQGAIAGNYGGLPGGLYPTGFALSRVISSADWANFDPADGELDPRTSHLSLPFKAVDGTVVKFQTDPSFNPELGGGNFWLNPYFNQTTTNEIAGATTGPDGKGAELMQVLTGVQSSGLGCGQRTQPVAGGDTTIPRCWIVVVPRGTATDENAGTPYAVDADANGVVTSPLSPTAWQNRIAIPIEFNPVDSPCSLSDDSRRIGGSELALPAVASWQPLLCGIDDLSPFAYGLTGDDTARQQLVSNQPGSPGMVVVSRPLASANLDPARPLVYAPISLSGLVVGFNVERVPASDAPAEEQLLAGVRVAQLNLTPRLVAKLLTQSYQQAVTILHPPDYPWMTANPVNMSVDPDFRQFNPEFELLQTIDGRTFSGVQLPAGNSDAATRLWEWVLGDPEARGWLDGEPDEWGMKVNPVYATTAGANPTGIAFGDPVPNQFPKADPYCYKAPARGPNNSIVPPPLCGTDWMPYKRTYGETAQVTRAAADLARINENSYALTSSDVWKAEGPQFLGRRGMLALTDTASAAQFGLQSARLSGSGDDGADRAFVAPDTAGLTAGLGAMAPANGTTVLQPSPTSTATGAYPLTMLTYAAISPLALDAQARAEYAAFIDYATGPGQVPGLALGQLPRGYAPLPDDLKAQATAAAEQVRTMVAPSVPTTTVPTTVEPTTTTVAPAEPAPIVTAPPTTRRTNTQPPATATTAPPLEAPTTTEVPIVIVVPTDTELPTTTTSPPEDDDKPTSGGLTPITDLASSRYAAPAFGVVALGSALGALEITKRPRRRQLGAPDDDTEPGEIELT